MIARRKLHHMAAGLLGKFMSRNNDYQSYWALGVLYTEARVSGLRVELDLLHGRAVPEAPACVSVARSYAILLRTALARHGVTPDMLSSATLSLAFGHPVPVPASAGAFGDRVECVLRIVAQEGSAVSRHASARCAPHDSRVFQRAVAMRGAAFRLYELVLAHGSDDDARRCLHRLHRAYTKGQCPALDLLRGCAAPPHPVADAVARQYAGRLRALLGEWVDELAAATVRLRFSTLPKPPGAAVFAEVDLIARDGYLVWSNGGGDMLPEAPPAATP